jgi:hypothetical protein
MGEMGNAYKILTGEPERKRPHGRPKCKWEDTILMNCKEVECEGVNWIQLAQDSVQCAA